MSHSPILTESQFTVWTDHVVHTETAVPFTSVVDDRFPDAMFLHHIPLVPEYWQTIVESPDPTRYTILHQVARVNNPASRNSTTWTASIADHFNGRVEFERRNLNMWLKKLSCYLVPCEDTRAGIVYGDPALYLGIHNFRLSHRLEAAAQIATPCTKNK
ncbi:hypothetical protein FB451DRAFT_1418869 [Mycena latifolia]|nr:hypothetical protein FB451DRAFT_1418869 [Mycena latifolia]